MSNNNGEKLESVPERQQPVDNGDVQVERVRVVAGEPMATATGFAMSSPTHGFELGNSGVMRGAMIERNNDDLISDAPCAERRETCEEAPALKSPNKIRDIVIKELDLGYIIKVGCQSFAIETPERVVTALSDYLNDPAVTEKNGLQVTF